MKKDNIQECDKKWCQAPNFGGKWITRSLKHEKSIFNSVMRGNGLGSFRAGFAALGSGGVYREHAGKESAGRRDSHQKPGALKYRVKQQV
jgi:hypothetical protein